jgi:hypothetical protein
MIGSNIFLYPIGGSIFASVTKALNDFGFGMQLFINTNSYKLLDKWLVASKYG